jgi:hypothetical protein
LLDIVAQSLYSEKEVIPCDFYSSL